MGFPVGFSAVLFPKLLIPTLTLLLYLRDFISALFLFLGLPDFLEPHIPPTHTADTGVPAARHRDTSITALLLRELLPVVKFSHLVDPPDSCAVCFYDFEREDEIRRLMNCRHVFHRSCLDRWMGYDRITCPLCRMSFVPDDMEGTFNERLWAAASIPESFDDY
ncbi:hypothetical protein Goshw_029442 [Gossypium schwendimanii]|uniref:RING-type domain-containing protein n=1 Tax=Gossypium schwendimanii TaxID=34291 RepID=A0A7J9LSF2_GOSSC|nr:hypothetical protein [Gossypium schwendimanii]